MGRFSKCLSSRNVGYGLAVVIIVLQVLSMMQSNPASNPTESRKDFGTATSGRLWMPNKIREITEDEKATILIQKPISWPSGEFWNQQCDNWATLTTISEPLEAVELIAKHEGWCLVVAGDKKGPPEYDLEGNGKIVYLSAAKQEELSELLPFVDATPWNHFSRKNIAFLYAIKNGAKYVLDFDDDNILSNPDILNSIASAEMQAAEIKTNCEALNPYPFFGATNPEAWPRGFPLDLIGGCEVEQTYCIASTKPTIGIFQTLADHDPDVDAIYRLTRKGFHFDFAGNPEGPNTAVLVPQDTLAPMNAQASVMSAEALWTLFLPTTVHGRVSDIWRSYIVQTLMPLVGIRTAFTDAMVVQIRNAHNYLADLDAEKQLYDRSSELVKYLLDWQKTELPKHNSLKEAWNKLYIDLYERDIVELKDVEMAHMWMSTLESIGYNFPPVNTRKADEGDCSNRYWTSRLVESKRSVSQQARIDGIVIAGVFQHSTDIVFVDDWVRKWEMVFRHVVVFGPFDDEQIKLLSIDRVYNNDGTADDFVSKLDDLGETDILFLDSDMIVSLEDVLSGENREPSTVESGQRLTDEGLPLLAKIKGGKVISYTGRLKSDSVHRYNVGSRGWIHNFYKHVITRTFVPYADPVPTFTRDEDDYIGVLGILTTTNEDGLKFRMAQRESWIPTAEKYRVKVYFLVDQSTPESEEENSKYHDIVNINSSYTGKAVRFGEKLYKWFVEARRRHPKALFIGKGDDDLVLCNDKLWPYLFETMNFRGTEYVGFRHNNREFPLSVANAEARIDEMFVLVGHELVERIIKRPYCVTDNKEECDGMDGLWDTNYGGTSLGVWLEKYDDLHSVPLNGKVIFQMGVTLEELQSKKNCDNYLLVHPIKNADYMKGVYNTTLF